MKLLLTMIVICLITFAGCHKASAKKTSTQTPQNVTTPAPAQPAPVPPAAPAPQKLTPEQAAQLRKQVEEIKEMQRRAAEKYRQDANDPNKK